MRYLMLLLFSSVAFADVDVREFDAQMFPDDVSYVEGIPTPAEFLGFELGTEPVRHHQLVEYIRLVASMSDRLRVETIGYSHERRPILFVVATSESNRNNLEQIRQRHVALTEPDSGQSVEDDMPIVTWLNYGVHGAEASGMDAALPFVYYLAAAEGEEIEAILDDSVILVTAIFNPDGHSKRIAWVDAYGGKRRVSNPDHMEHQSSWRFARTNHYWFDLNRQWLLVTQPEPKAWMKKWHQWRPNLTVDYHEMGGAQTYYFHPGVRTRTNPLAPEAAEVLMARTAAFSEEVLDREGRLYFQGERFDNYYVGKGSTFPLLNGGVGILYEAAAALGREIETPNGLRTYRENIRKQFRTSIASIRAGASQRLDYLRYQKRFYSDAVDAAEKSPTQAWVFSANGDSARLRAFIELLETHRIDAFALTRDFERDGIVFEQAHSMVVPTAQPQYTLIRSIFETVDTFEDATFYDVSTWTLPPAFGLDYAELSRRELRGLAGGEYAFETATGAVPQSSFGYVLEWAPYLAPRALYRLLEEGLLARVATEPFQVETTEGPRSLPRGSIFVPLDRQTVSREEILALMQDVAGIEGQRVHALTSGRSVNGTRGVNVGGPSFHPLRKPEVLMAIGEAVDLYDAGEIWHLLDYRMDIPLTMRDVDKLADIDWSRYTHIVMPSGDYSALDPLVSDRLRQWISEGGTLVAFSEAITWLRGVTLDYVPEPDGVLAPDMDATVEDEMTEDAEDEEPVGRFDYASKDDREAVDVLGGAIFRADLDTSHPLGFGISRRDIALHKNHKEVLEPTDNPYAVVIQYAEQPLLSGYASEENRQAIASTPALIAERYESGSIILFADNTNFRGYWYGTNKLFLNSLFFSKAFSAPEE
ncbi:MAG: M14 family zinc carboxypeptidase [Woeseiaceae bacterium]|nr:M14 family zinc carboxypeptidase [Woeseiaceae bacterium]